MNCSELSDLSLQQRPSLLKACLKFSLPALILAPLGHQYSAQHFPSFLASFELT